MGGCSKLNGQCCHSETRDLHKPWVASSVPLWKIMGLDLQYNSFSVHLTKIVVANEDISASSLNVVP